MPSKSARAYRASVPLLQIHQAFREDCGAAFCGDQVLINGRFFFIGSFPLQICDDSKAQHFEYRV
jgi:hypothetical protein